MSALRESVHAALRERALLSDDVLVAMITAGTRLGAPPLLGQAGVQIKGECSAALTMDRTGNRALWSRFVAECVCGSALQGPWPWCG